MTAERRLRRLTLRGSLRRSARPGLAAPAEARREPVGSNCSAGGDGAPRGLPRLPMGHRARRPAHARTRRAVQPGPVLARPGDPVRPADHPANGNHASARRTQMVPGVAGVVAVVPQNAESARGHDDVEGHLGRAVPGVQEVDSSTGWPFTSMLPSLSQQTTWSPPTPRRA